MNLRFLPTKGKRLIKSELIEIIIPDPLLQPAQSKIQLPDNPNLRNVYLWGIESFYDSDMPVSPLSNYATGGGGTPVLRFSLMESIFLTLQDYNGDNFQWQKPLQDFRTLKSFRGNVLPDNTEPKTEANPNNFVGQTVNWSKSYIEFSTKLFIQEGHPTSVPLMIYYSDRSAAAIKSDKKATFKNRS